MNPHKSSSFNKSYSKHHTKTNFINHSKQQNLYKPSKKSINKGSYYNQYPQNAAPKGKANRKSLVNCNISFENMPLKAKGFDQSIDLHKYLDSFDISISNLNVLNILNQNGTALYYSNNERNIKTSSLAGFKIVQNGIIIHDEISAGQAAKSQNENCSATLTGGKSQHYTESIYTLKPCSKTIPMPSFIEVCS